LDRLGKSETYADFISDTIENSGVKLIRLSVKDLKEIYHICKQFNLDFDDSYQYLSALKHGYINNHYNVQTFQRANVQT